jgi:RNA recognition motif-containing protein
MMRIYVENLSKKITDARLNELALPFGKPNSANIARQLRGGASKGFGFIEYAMAAEAHAAIRGLDGKKVDGQTLRVCDANALKAQPWSAAHRSRE